jgi:Flp pilus assembly protein TadG
MQITERSDLDKLVSRDDVKAELEYTNKQLTKNLAKQNLTPVEGTWSAIIAIREGLHHPAVLVRYQRQKGDWVNFLGGKNHNWYCAQNGEWVQEPDKFLAKYAHEVDQYAVFGCRHENADDEKNPPKFPGAFELSDFLELIDIGSQKMTTTLFTNVHIAGIGNEQSYKHFGITAGTKFGVCNNDYAGGSLTPYQIAACVDRDGGRTPGSLKILKSRVFAQFRKTGMAGCSGSATTETLRAVEMLAPGGFPSAQHSLAITATCVVNAIARDIVAATASGGTYDPDASSVASGVKKQLLAHGVIGAGNTDWTAGVDTATAIAVLASKTARDTFPLLFESPVPTVAESAATDVARILIDDSLESISQSGREHWTDVETLIKAKSLAESRQIVWTKELEQECNDAIKRFEG